MTSTDTADRYAEYAPDHTDHTTGRFLTELARRSPATPEERYAAVDMLLRHAADRAADDTYPTAGDLAAMADVHLRLAQAGR